MNYEGKCSCGDWISVDLPYSGATIKVEHKDHGTMTVVFIGPPDPRKDAE